MIPQDTVAKILDSAQIVEVVGDFVTLRRRGANYVACCPFHNEKTPSFYVSPAKGIYKCFGCGKSGTAVGFVMEHENLSYVEALKYLARKYHIEVVEKELSAEEIAAQQRSESLLLVSDYAARFYKDALKEGEGRAAGYAYFRSRGLEEATIEKYGLGWAPRGRHALLDAARAEGYKDEYLVATGLVKQYEDGRMADLFSERVMFPIHSVSGRIVAFGGRTLSSDKSVPKYVNSPTTEIYLKDKTLYGLYFARSEVVRQGCCYIVEGYLDVLSMHQLGITNVVAPCGTSFTVDQIRVIHKYTENLVLMFDGDGAGIHAAERGIGLALKEGLNVKVVLIPDGDDPDSYSRKHNLEEVRTFLAEHEQDFISFKTDRVLAQAGDDPLRRAELINDIADTIALIPDQVKRTVFVQAAATRFEMDTQILFDRVRRTREKMLIDDRNAADREQNRQQRLAEVPEAEVPVTPVETLPEPTQPRSALASSEQELLWFILTEGTSPLEFESDHPFYDPENPCSVADFIRGNLEADRFEFLSPLYRRAWDAYFALYDADPDLEQDEIVRRLMDGADRAVADLTATLTQERYQLSVKNYRAALTTTKTMLVQRVPRSIRVYQAERLAVRLREIETKMKDATPEQLTGLFAEFQQVTSLRKTVLDELGRVQ